jgi:hypothetical protein
VSSGTIDDLCLLWISDQLLLLKLVLLLRSQPLILLCVWMCLRLKKWQDMIRMWGLWVFAKAVWFDRYVVSMKINWRYNCRMVLTRNSEQMAMSLISVVRMRWALLSLNLCAVWCPCVTDAMVWLAGWFELQGGRSPYQRFRWGRRPPPPPTLPPEHTHNPIMLHFACLQQLFCHIA